MDPIFVPNQKNKTPFDITKSAHGFTKYQLERILEISKGLNFQHFCMIDHHECHPRRSGPFILIWYEEGLCMQRLGKNRPLTKVIDKTVVRISTSTGRMYSKGSGLDVLASLTIPIGRKR